MPEQHKYLQGYPSQPGTAHRPFHELKGRDDTPFFSLRPYPFELSIFAFQEVVEEDR